VEGRNLTVQRHIKLKGVHNWVIVRYDASNPPEFEEREATTGRV